MATTNFLDQETTIEASWLNDIDDIVYSLSLTTSGNGASRIGVQDSAGNFASTTVEAVLAEIIADYALTTNGNGASKIGIEDSATQITATTVEGALAEIVDTMQAHVVTMAATTNGNGASLVGIEDSATQITATTVEGALAEIVDTMQAHVVTMAATTNGNGASLIGIEDAATQITATTVEGALTEIVDTQQAHVVTMAATTNGNGSSLVGVEDASSYWTGTDAEAVLDEIGQHIVSAQKFIPISLHSLREATSFDVGNIAANGGILASDTTPVLDAINAATDGCQRILWASSDSQAVIFQTPLPPDLDVASNIVIHHRIVSGGTTDAVGFDVLSFFNEGDSFVADTSGTNQTTTYAEVTTTVAAADVPAGAQTLSVSLTPVSHTTDTMAMSAVWIEYTGLLRTA